MGKIHVANIYLNEVIGISPDYIIYREYTKLCTFQVKYVYKLLIKAYTNQPQWHCHYVLDQISVSSHVYVYGQPNDPRW